jgi:hypothetical protein
MPTVDGMSRENRQATSAPSERLVLVASRISVAERTKLAQLARCHDRTVSREIRRAIRAYIAHQRRTAERTDRGHDPATEAVRP